QGKLAELTACEKALEDLSTYWELLDEDPSLASEAQRETESLTARVRSMEVKEMLSGPNDNAAAIVHINGGAGGTEAQDWAQMLLRMYLRYCEERGFKTQVVDTLPGEEAGIKSATFMAQGSFAYGLLAAEIGVHRLVRISPFDSNARRHTSF